MRTSLLQALWRVVPRGIALRTRQSIVARRVLRGLHLEADVRALAAIGRPTDVCWDIGANAGAYSVPLSRLCRRVEAFDRMRVPSDDDGGYCTAALAEDGSVPVQSSTIDALIAGGLPEPALIKCDVEGSGCGVCAHGGSGRAARSRAAARRRSGRGSMLGSDLPLARRDHRP